MRKWLSSKVDEMVAKATKKAAEKAAEEATERTVRRVKETAKGALDRAEQVLFGPEEEPVEPRTEKARGEGPGALQKAREDADRRAAERSAEARAAAKRRDAEVDDELARMKRRLGK